ncbi:cupin domain-containing protein [Pandoraea apista]|uniref:cupin domain-containing protein n=1 Tax=Pandoraea apista TaxID=93218 RepID=UPI000B8C1700|nr:cupin domain-containing protein [Pandoraea apista]OXS92889.1 cupin [Pandoraea apista]
MPSAADLVTSLGLQPHPEGGHYRETYRASGKIAAQALPDGFSGARNISTAILYLLEADDFSAFHRIRSDEIWHFHLGGTLRIHEIAPDGKLTTTCLGADVAAGEQLQHVVPAGHWFAAQPAPSTRYSLVGCTVAPGFAFEDFELAVPAALAAQWPAHRVLIERLARGAPV